MTRLAELNMLLLTSIPELEEGIRRGIDEWKQSAGGAEPSADYLFGSVLAPIVVELLSDVADPSAHDAAAKVLVFLERLLADENAAVRNVVEVSFCEQIAEFELARQRARAMAGPLLRRWL